jgi:hypothetical protein
MYNEIKLLKAVKRLEWLREYYTSSEYYEQFNSKFWNVLSIYETNFKSYRFV